MEQNKSSNDKKISKSSADVSQKHAETILQSIPQNMKGKKIDEKLLKQAIFVNPPSPSSLFHAISIKETDITREQHKKTILDSIEDSEK